MVSHRVFLTSNKVWTAHLWKKPVSAVAYSCLWPRWTLRTNNPLQGLSTTHTAIQSWVMCCPREAWTAWTRRECLRHDCNWQRNIHRYVQTTMKPKANLKKETSFRHVGSSAYTVPLGYFKKEVKPQRIQFAFNFPAFSSNAILRVPSIQPMMLWWQGRGKT